MKGRTGVHARSDERLGERRFGILTAVTAHGEIHRSKLTTFYTLNRRSLLCQLYLNIAGKTRYGGKNLKRNKESVSF